MGAGTWTRGDGMGEGKGRSAWAVGLGRWREWSLPRRVKRGGVACVSPVARRSSLIDPSIPSQTLAPDGGWPGPWTKGGRSQEACEPRRRRVQSVGTSGCVAALGEGCSGGWEETPPSTPQPPSALAPCAPQNQTKEVDARGGSFLSPSCRTLPFPSLPWGSGHLGTPGLRRD